MKTLKLITAITALTTLCSCYHNSALKHEMGVVVEKQYSPQFDGSGTGIGFSTGGDVVITSNDVHKDEQYMLVFRCQHNTLFSADKKDLYMVLQKGDSVDIQYFDVLNDKNELVKYKFYTATKK